MFPFYVNYCNTLLCEFYMSSIYKYVFRFGLIPFSTILQCRSGEDEHIEN